MRHSGRAANELRPITLETDVNRYAEGSCLAKFGNTHVLCTATIEESVPGWMKGSGRGWITAEYGMLPRSTQSRMGREAARGKQSGRTQEIQRLIGRSLRAVIDLQGFGERQIRIDCDVLQADGGTRTAAITGSYVALYQAFQLMQEMKAIETIPFVRQVAAISCGIHKGQAIIDLDYEEDSAAETDANFVLTDDGQVVEVQATAEEKPFSRVEFDALMDLAIQGVSELAIAQRNALGLED
ncbi:ribonuclease PH [Limibacillus halophilus]|uniref:Ribonuclease PH n=1 Tax=Limibacillus halophilus TaxID=1579333 RepID=A0A839SN67_9PROT|nr:ribonuclease PH [Limibacillus halophilus]MBB3063892.1 ribonuclease PH [Limibacillus halophilus]